MPKMRSISDEEKRFRAEDDARTLIKAQEILKDKSRLAMAKKHVMQQADAVSAAEKQLKGK